MNRLATALFVSTTLVAAGRVAQALTGQEPAAQDPTTEAPPTHIVVRGQLLDGSFAPAAGVPISRVAADDPDYRSAIRKAIGRSDENGRFEVRIARRAESRQVLLVGGESFATCVWTLRCAGRAIAKHWPVPRNDRNLFESHDIEMHLRTGSTHTFYLPDRSGAFTVTSGTGSWEIDLEGTRNESFELEVGRDRIRPVER